MEGEKKKYPIPRGAAATAAKNKYRNKAYDRIEVVFPKGTKELIAQAVGELGYSSKNAFITTAVAEKYERETGKGWNVVDDTDN